MATNRPSDSRPDLAEIRHKTAKEQQMTIAHPRPSEPTLSVQRAPVDGNCPQCGTSALQAYPLLSEGGWFDVVKCAHCLHSVARNPGPKLGPIELLADRI
jgi:hypothetical protein